MNKIRWNLEFQINLICLDEATRTRADDQNPERSKKSSFLVGQIQTRRTFFQIYFTSIKDLGVFWTTILEQMR